MISFKKIYRASMTNILLCDMGGTHARFAKRVDHGEYSDFKKYRLNEFQSFEDIIQTYLDETGLEFNNALFAVARTIINGKITYKRFAGDPDYIIDFNLVKSRFNWPNLQTLNDLEAGAYGANILNADQKKEILPRKGDKWNDHKILISVGTGVGHAGIMDNKILRTAGGHFFPITVTEEQRNFENFIRSRKNFDTALIMEDFVSARGLKMVAEFISHEDVQDLSNEGFMDFIKNHPDSVRLFFEFLGLHAQNIVSVTGFYGGVCITGGVIDHLIKHNLVDWNAFENFFRPKKITPVVLKRLKSTPVHYVLHDELPLLGLSTL